MPVFLPAFVGAKSPRLIGQPLFVAVHAECIGSSGLRRDAARTGFMPFFNFPLHQKVQAGDSPELVTPWARIQL